VCISFIFKTEAQKIPKREYLPGLVVGNDTLPHFDLPAVNVFPKRTFRNKSEEQQYWRMVMRVKKVLPYAREAAVLLKKYELEVPENARNKDRRVYLRKAEDELINKYGPTFKKMSINDGKILIKLIDRETRKISYDLIHELKGGVSAVFWQGVARIFGNNLKSRYDPAGEDWQIEQIIRSIDMGII
jgi:hypothetical protein